MRCNDAGPVKITLFMKYVATCAARQLVNMLVPVCKANPASATCSGSYRRLILGTLTVFALIVAYANVALAHGGGTPQLVNSEAGPYRLFVWTQPEPLHAGDVHVTVAVILPDSQGETQNDAGLNQNDLAVTDATVGVTFRLPQTSQEIAVQATLGEWTGVPYYEADVTLPAAGDWQTNIDVDGPQGKGEVTFALSILPPREINWPLVAGGSFAVLVLLGLAIGWSRMQSGRTESAAVGV